MQSSKLEHEAMVIWITGLSGSGKTTLSHAFIPQLKAAGHSVVYLDGDTLRSVFKTEDQDKAHYGRANRLKLASQYAALCKMLAEQGHSVVIATISMFKEIHAWNRDNIDGYFEVYLKVPIDELRRRDPKGIYKRFDNGEISHVSGLDLDVDEPENPDMLIEFDPERSAETLASDLLSKITKG